ncbi:hypothetical protein HDU76_005174, partial [Blyttiomyces sp. JEL0837]
MRSDNLIAQNDLYEWRPSQICIPVGLIYALVGIAVRSIMLLPLGILFNLIDAVQNLVTIAKYPDEALSTLRIVGNMLPGILFHLFAYGRAYHTELSFRIQFSGMKRAQGSIAKVAEIDKTMTSLLGNVLPKSVIPRLIESNYQFSTVTDRIPRAYCIFVDFFHDGRIKQLDPDVAASTLNETFCTFDEVLAAFPLLEKIKTISSKCMLMAVDDSDTTNPGLDVTNLLMKIQTEFSNVMQQRLSVLKTDIKVGVAYGSIVAGIVGREKFIYDIYSDTEKVTNLPTPRSSQVWRTKAPSIRDSRLHTPNRVSSSQRPAPRNNSAYEFKAQMKSLFSPAVEFANYKAAEDRGLLILGLDSKKNMYGNISTRLLNSRNDSRSLSLVDIGKLNAKIAPLDTSRYLDSITTINVEDSDAVSYPALQKIISKLSS